MIPPMFYRLLALFLISTIGGSKCEASRRETFWNKSILEFIYTKRDTFACKQNRPKDDSVLQKGMSDQEGEPDYLNQANQNTRISVF